jgi:hypothetical protein
VVGDPQAGTRSATCRLQGDLCRFITSTPSAAGCAGGPPIERECPSSFIAVVTQLVTHGQGGMPSLEVEAHLRAPTRASNDLRRAESFTGVPRESRPVTDRSGTDLARSAERAGT